MDILIKNMKMPSEGRIINLTICSDGSVINNLPDAGGKMSSYRSERVKAVALPSHGRLGDLDALKNSVADMRMEKPLRNGAKQVIEIGELFGRIIDDAPTIVEANNE